MKMVKQALPWQRRTPLGFEVRYERSFLLDLQQIEPVSFRYIKHFVFEEFHQLSQLQELPGFRQIGASGIFYRFTLDRYFVSLEITGQLVKFLRVLPIPQV
jgi:hypothetical protein